MRADQIDTAMIFTGPDFVFVHEDTNSMVDEIHPRQPFLRINVLCWREVFRMIETSNSDVDLIGATLGFVGEGSAARIAESSKRACVSFISMRFPSFPFEVGALHDGPRDRLGAGRATAVFAMAIRGDARLPVYREANLSAVTSASDHDHFEKIDMNQEPATLQTEMLNRERTGLPAAMRLLPASPAGWSISDGARASLVCIDTIKNRGDLAPAGPIIFLTRATVAPARSCQPSFSANEFQTRI